LGILVYATSTHARMKTLAVRYNTWLWLYYLPFCR